MQNGFPMRTKNIFNGDIKHQSQGAYLPSCNDQKLSPGVPTEKKMYKNERLGRDFTTDKSKALNKTDRKKIGI